MISAEGTIDKVRELIRMVQILNRVILGYLLKKMIFEQWPRGGELL